MFVTSAGRFFNTKLFNPILPDPWEFCIPQNSRYSPWPNQQPHKIDFRILILWDHYFITHTCCWRSKKEKTQTLHTSEVTSTALLELTFCTTCCYR